MGHPTLRRETQKGGVVPIARTWEDWYWALQNADTGDSFKKKNFFSLLSLFYKYVFVWHMHFKISSCN